VLLTREPGGAPGAEELRTLLLSGTIDWSPEAETLLHFAARAQHLARAIRPALFASRWVVCDRYFDSTMAYQGYGLGVDRELIDMLSRHCLPPDLTFVLDLDPAIAHARLSGRSAGRDRYERMDAAFHRRVAAGFRTIADAEPDRCVLIEAGDAEATVRQAINRALRSRLGAPLG
jgi:dTMP kinase